MNSNHYLNNSYLEGVISRFQEVKKNKNIYENILEDLLVEPNKEIKKPGTEININLVECKEEVTKITDEYNELQDILAEAFLKLADNLARYTRYNYVDSDDAIQEGVMTCFAKIDRFNPKFGKAFNYLSTITLNAYRQMYRSGRNFAELKNKFRDHLESKIEYTVSRRCKESHLRLISRKFDLSNDKDI